MQTIISTNKSRACLLTLLVLVATAVLVGPMPAKAASSAPWWHISARALPTNLAPGAKRTLQVIATNLGDAPVNGEAVTVSATVPAGTTVEAVDFFIPELGYFAELLGGYLCTHTSSTVQCTLPGEPERKQFSEALGGVTIGVRPFQYLEVEVHFAVPAGANSGEAAASVDGGGAPEVSTSQPTAVSARPARFGVQEYSIVPEAEGGAPDAQAGSHPFQLTTALALNTVDRTKPNGNVFVESQQPRNLRFSLPAGLVGNASATSQCTTAQFGTLEKRAGGLAINRCSPTTAIGAAVVAAVEPFSLGLKTYEVPIFNLTPAPGEPARFGFTVAEVPVYLKTSLHSGGDYGVNVNIDDVPQNVSLISSLATIWGVPDDPRHAQSRGWTCLLQQLFPAGACAQATEPHPEPLLTLPSSCRSPLQAPITVQSWADGAIPLLPTDSIFEESLEGCNREPFEPQLKLESSASSADTPTQLTVHVKVPQEASEAPEGTAEADVKNTTVALPPGLQINPAAAAGLQGCSEQDIGYRGQRGKNGELLFDEETEAEKDGETPQKQKYTCPEASKLGKVSIKTPLLQEELTGWVYQAAQNANPFGSLLAIYVIAEAPQRGVRVRLAGEVKVEKGGRLVSTFPVTPQLPFEEFKLQFFGGGRAALATSGCGYYATTSSIEPWSSPSEGALLAHPGSEFDVSSGPEGGSCASLGGFAPSFAAGAQSAQAGAFTPFTMTLARKDGEQSLSTVAMTMPKGLAGMLSKVPLCGQAQASVGSCSAASQIGHVVVHAGVGNEPIELPQAGRPQDPVYLTGPYDGAPFGLAIVVPAEAGPFNLDEGGHPVVVRAKIEVNPTTAQVSIVSGAMPTQLQNIALDVRSVEVIVDHPDFMFNPTNCAAMSVTGSIGSAEGASAAVSSFFQVANCASLPFHPSFSALTHSFHSRKRGAYLHVVVRSGPGQANIAKVHVTLPAKLPSRESTLKQACTAAQFGKDPAGCPKGSFVGSATAYTPVLGVPLKGPAIFVSNGSAGYPNLDVVLQGDGVSVDLTGNTRIAKGLTSSTFASVPDVPISRFDLVLPEGPHSALAALGGLCTRTVTGRKRVRLRRHGHFVYRTAPVHRKAAIKLKMPTTITGQNGAVIHRSTPIMVSGCGKRNTKKAGHRRHHHS